MTQIDRYPRCIKAAFLGISTLLAAYSPAAIAESSPKIDGADRGQAQALAESCAGRAEDRESWVAAAPPAHIHGATYYVGTCGIAALLVTSDKGHVLIDGGPGQAAPLVAENITKLGFKLSDVRWIVSSHEHWDHVGALAELKRLTGAKVAALPIAAEVLASGKAHPEDPQRLSADQFTPVSVDRVLTDGEALQIGKLRLTAHVTPAHAPGSASWTWKSCSADNCRTIAYADSATIISDDAYRFSDHPARIAEAREGLARIKALPCDILITPHPGASDLFTRMSGKSDLIDPQACRAYANAAESRFASRLATEAGKATK